jgi:hypothetical protein
MTTTSATTTSATTATTAAATGPSARPGTVGVGPVLRVLAVAACLPYLVLKIIWISGNPLGTTGATGAHEMLDGRHLAGNIVTGLMELAAIVLVVGLTSRWGRRIPPALVLLPMWVGTGLLLPVAVSLPSGLAVQALIGGSPIPQDPGLHPWVFAVVYGGLGAEALLLLSAFVLHARRRWTTALGLHVAGPGTGRSRPVQLVCADAGALAAVAVAVVHLVWAFAGTGAAGPSGFDTAAQRNLLAVTGLLVVAGAVGTQVVVRGRGAGPLWPWLVAAWTGSGVLFAGQLYASVADAAGHPLVQLVAMVGALAGLGLGVAGMLAMLERGAATP